MEQTKNIENEILMEQIQNNRQEKGASSYQIIVFKLGTEEYGMVIDQIKEVVITPNIAKIPLAPSYVKGVANIRGNIISIIDLVERFSFEKDKTSDEIRNYTLVVEREDFKMGILVKDVPNTLSITDAEIDRSPGIIQDSSIDSNYIKGIVKSGNRMIILIDVYKVISKEEISKSILSMSNKEFK
jgi:purine-binding chemotaxis protein CheW